MRGGREHLDASDKQGALALARTGAGKSAAAEESLVVYCEAALLNDSISDLRSCVASLNRIAPQAPSTQLFGSLLQAYEGNWSEAIERIDQAHAQGLPESIWRSTRDST